MTSQIDETKPATGQAFTADMRGNFAAAAAEISDLQARVAALEAAALTTAGVARGVKVSTANAALNNAVANGGLLRFDTVHTDTDAYAPTTSPFDAVTIPAGLSGVYLLIASSSGSATQSTTLGMGVLVNGSQAFSETNQSITGPQSVAYTLDNGAVEFLRLVAGDTVQLRNNSVSAGTNAFQSTTMSLVRIGA